MTFFCVYKVECLWQKWMWSYTLLLFLTHSVCQNQDAQYLNWVNPWKWKNLWANYSQNCNPRPPFQTKKDLKFTQLIMKFFSKIFDTKCQRFSLPSNGSNSNSENIWARKVFFCLKRSEFHQKLIGNVISELCRQKLV